MSSSATSATGALTGQKAGSVVVQWRNIKMNDWEILIEHVGHKIVITHYELIGEVCVECEDCNQVLLVAREDEE
jgi:hypothetical protein